jgi:hypothetical protein
VCALKEHLKHMIGEREQGRERGGGESSAVAVCMGSPDLVFQVKHLLGVPLALAAERLLSLARSRLERLQVYLLKKISKVNAPSN